MMRGVVLALIVGLASGTVFAQTSAQAPTPTIDPKLPPMPSLAGPPDTGEMAKPANTPEPPKAPPPPKTPPPKPAATKPSPPAKKELPKPAKKPAATNTKH